MGCLSECLVPLPAFGSCFVEFAQLSNDLLMNLWGIKWSPCPIPLPSYWIRDRDFNALEYTPKCRISGNYGRSIFHFFEEPPSCLSWSMHKFTFPAIVHKGYPFSITSITLVIPCLFHNTNSNIMVLICIPLIINDFEHPFLLAIFYLCLFFITILQHSAFFWVLKNWCFWTLVLEKTLESPLDGKEI